MPKNMSFWAISGQKKLFIWLKGDFYLATMLCNVVRPPTISIPWHNLQKLCNDMVIP